MTIDFHADNLVCNFINGAPPLTSPATTKGDLLVDDGTALQRLGVGANAFVLTADSTQALGVKWAAVPAGFSNPMTALGDLIAGGAAGAATRLPVGSNGLVLVADSSQALGVKWAAATPLTTKGDILTFGAAPDRLDRKSTRLNSSHITRSRMPSSA